MKPPPLVTIVILAMLLLMMMISTIITVIQGSTNQEYIEKYMEIHIFLFLAYCIMGTMSCLPGQSQQVRRRHLRRLLRPLPPVDAGALRRDRGHRVLRGRAHGLQLHQPRLQGEGPGLEPSAAPGSPARSTALWLAHFARISRRPSLGFALQWLSSGFTLEGHGLLRGVHGRYPRQPATSVHAEVVVVG